MENGPDRFVLRDLPLPTRAVLAVFLLAVGLGYFSALVQLHFQHATAGQLLPGPEEAVDHYHGKPPMSQFERLITAPESKPFNGSGQMSAVFFLKGGLKNMAKARAIQKKIPMEQAMAEARREREGERDAVVEWARSNDAERAKAYEDDKFPVPDRIKEIDAEFIEEDKPGERFLYIRQVIDNRCVRCHRQGARDAPGRFPLDDYEFIKIYLEPETNGGGMSLPKLAQSTHVHMLGFAMLFGLTGVIFSLSSYPQTLRLILGPWTLIAQIADISCWWLGRADPMFAKAILLTGGFVGLGLAAQIVLSLFNMFDKKGKVIVAILLLLGVAGVGGLFVSVIGPYLVSEAQSAGANP